MCAVALSCLGPPCSNPKHSLGQGIGVTQGLCGDGAIAPGLVPREDAPVGRRGGFGRQELPVLGQ